VARVTIDDIPANLLARRWGVRQCAVFRTLSSSLDAIHDVAAQGAPAGTVVVVEEQTAGRGRDGRTWRSPLGGVWLGMLLRPPVPVLGALSLRVGLVLADVVDELVGTIPPRARLKWPNDVLVDDRKIAGILCEARWQGDALQWLGLGVGINVANEIPPDLAGRAIALRELLPNVRRIDVLDRLVPALVPLTTHHTPLTESECGAFAQRDWLRGRQLRAPVAGRAAGVRDDGALLVETGSGAAVVREGHVELS
jgi:BirA family biotin operon repressor/biotin-[acetyl-CoA-carboxylase] ligase